MGNEQSGSISDLTLLADNAASATSMFAKLSRQPTTESVDNIDVDHPTPTRGIVTVHSGGGESTSQYDDTAALIDKLRSVPVCYPILPSSVGLQDKFFSLESKPMLCYFLRLQDFLKQCAEAVAFDQTAINVRMRELEMQTRLLHDAVAARQKQAARAAEQLDKARELSATLTRVQNSLDATVALADRLNQLLPPAEQLEPFTVVALTACTNN